jgi:hypothetical protein
METNKAPFLLVVGSKFSQQAAAAATYMETIRGWDIFLAPFLVVSDFA